MIDLVVETSRAPAAIAAGLRAAERGGDMVMAGLPPEDVPIDLTGQVVLREVVLRGVYGRRIDRTWLDMERALLSGLDIERVITHSFPLENFVEAIRTARGAAAGKVLFDMSGI